MRSRRAWDGTAGVADREDRPVAVFATRDANTAARAIIFPRIFEQILQDKSHVMLLTSNMHLGTIAFDLGIRAIGQGAQIIHLGLDQMREIDGTEGDLQPARIHLRKKQQVFDDARNSKGLMN